MKATLVGMPEFRIRIDLETAEALKQMASRHYDASVKRLSHDTLYRWVGRFSWAEPEEFDDEGCIEVAAATFSELNLIAKTLESRSADFAFHLLTREMFNKLDELAKLLGRCMATANEIYQEKSWVREITSP